MQSGSRAKHPIRPFPNAKAATTPTRKLRKKKVPDIYAQLPMA
jgi:hypothetical protein